MNKDLKSMAIIAVIVIILGYIGILIPKLGLAMIISVLLTPFVYLMYKLFTEW